MDRTRPRHVGSRRPPERAAAAINERTVIHAAALQDHFARALKLDVQIRQLNRVRRKPEAAAPTTRSASENQHAEEAQYDPWTCERCTVYNAEGPPRCKSCGSSRKAQLREIARNERDQRTLAQRLGLLQGPPAKLTKSQWRALEKASDARKDSYVPCAICQEHFGTGEQLLLSCSHVFHKSCLESFERFVRSKERCCPLCRKANYEKRAVRLGIRAHRQRSATCIQCVFRGFAARKRYRASLSAFYASGKGTAAARHKFFAGRLSDVAQRLERAVSAQEDSIDRLFAEFDTSISASRRVFGAPTEDLPRAIGPEKWQAILNQLLHREGDSCECAICMGAIPLANVSVASSGQSTQIDTADTRTPLLLSCSHCFHKQCIEAFERFTLDKAASCPMCRSQYAAKISLSSTA